MARVTALAGGAVLILATPSYAYLDPVSGSVILQVILGGIAGLLVLFKMYYRKLRTLLRGGRRSGSSLEGPR